MATETAIVPYRPPTRFYIPCNHVWDFRSLPVPFFAMPLHGWQAHVRALRATFGRPYFIDDDDILEPWLYTAHDWERDRAAGLWKKARALNAFRSRVPVLRTMRRVMRAWSTAAEESALAVGGGSFAKARARFEALTGARSQEPHSLASVHDGGARRRPVLERG